MMHIVKTTSAFGLKRSLTPGSDFILKYPNIIPIVCFSGSSEEGRIIFSKPYSVQKLQLAATYCYTWDIRCVGKKSRIFS